MSKNSIKKTDAIVLLVISPLLAIYWLGVVVMVIHGNMNRIMANIIKENA